MTTAKDAGVMEYRGVVTLTYHCFACPKCGMGRMVVANIMADAGGKKEVPVDVAVPPKRGGAPCGVHRLPPAERDKACADHPMPPDLAAQVRAALEERDE